VALDKEVLGPAISLSRPQIRVKQTGLRLERGIFSPALEVARGKGVGSTNDYRLAKE
jgi:hypothetical protein